MDRQRRSCCFHVGHEFEIIAHIVIRGEDRYGSLLPKFDETKKCEQNRGRRSPVGRLNCEVHIAAIEKERLVKTLMLASQHRYRPGGRHHERYALERLF
jgi:hypothetical protein